jgi:hypothetical protein
MKLRDSRQDFVQSWLTEMPEGVGAIELFDMLEWHIRDRIRSGSTPEKLDSHWRKIMGSQTVYYWYERDGNIVLAAEFSPQPQALVVNAVARNPGYRGAPWATDLYELVLNDTQRSLRIHSDTQLSDAGLELWKRFVRQGHRVSVYDRQNPGQSFHTVTEPDELEKYFQPDNRDYRRYQYVLSEASDYPELVSVFNTRRMRELSGLSLE